MPNLTLDRNTTAVIASELSKQNVANRQTAQERNIIGNARRVMDAARAAGIPVIHVTVGLREGYLEVNERNKLFAMIKDRGILRAGSEEMEIHDGVKAAPDEIVINKTRVSPFYGTELESVLRARNVDTVVIMGIETNFSVEAAVRYAADADYRVVLLEDCCAAQRQEDHDWTVQSILSRLADVASSEDFVASLS